MLLFDILPSLLYAQNKMSNKDFRRLPALWQAALCVVPLSLHCFTLFRNALRTSPSSRLILPQAEELKVLQSLTGHKSCTNYVEKVHSILRMHFLYGSKLHAALSLIYTVKEHFPNPLSWEGSGKNTICFYT